MNKTYKSELSAAIHETAEGLYEHGIIDKTTMKEFDASVLCLWSKLLLKKSGLSAKRNTFHSLFLPAT